MTEIYYKFAFLLFLGTGLACDGGTPPSRVVETVVPLEAKPSAIALEEFQPGGWRLASMSDVSNTKLWLSHILIRHRDAANQGAVPLSVWPWRVVAPTVERNRREALRLATHLASKARQKPEDFAALANRYSDDITTRGFGGRLGGVPAAQLLSVLDAVTATPHGQVSKVIESSFGFHVLLHETPPPAEVLSGARIVVGYSGANWRQVVGATEQLRSRDAALKLATRIHTEVLESPERFSELVQKYTEHPDRTLDGDIGNWKNEDVSFLARELEVLRRLPMGGVAPPLDSPVGFEILRRTPLREQTEVAVEAIRVQFNPGAESEAQARSYALDLAEQVRQDPSVFDQLRRDHCCSGAVRVTAGRDESSELLPLVRQLKIGEVGLRPVRSYATFAIPRRVSLNRSHAPRAASLTLPARKHIDLDSWIRNVQPEVAESTLLAVVEQAGLSTDQRQVVEQYIVELNEGTEREKRAPLLRKMLNAVQLQVEQSALLSNYEELLLSRLEKPRLQIEYPF